MCAIGSNEKVAKYSAIDIDKIRLRTYVIVGVMVAITAVLISARLNSISSTNAGKDYEMDAIAAVVIGGTAMTGGHGSIWGSVVGAIILGIINNMLNMLGVSPYLQGSGERPCDHRGGLHPERLVQGQALGYLTREHSGIGPSAYGFRFRFVRVTFSRRFL